MALVIHNEFVDVIAVTNLADESGDDQLHEVPCTVHYLASTCVSHELEEAVLSQ